MNLAVGAPVLTLPIGLILVFALVVSVVYLVALGALGGYVGVLVYERRERPSA